jgi:hypothetical protein
MKLKLTLIASAAYFTMTLGAYALPGRLEAVSSQSEERE